MTISEEDTKAWMVHDIQRHEIRVALEKADRQVALLKAEYPDVAPSIIDGLTEALESISNIRLQGITMHGKEG